MRARERVYHINCFRCVACQRQLCSGDEFAVRRDDGALVCRDHYNSDDDDDDGGIPAVLHGLPPASDLLPVVQSAVHSAVSVSDELLSVDSDIATAISTSTLTTKHVVNNNNDNNCKNKRNSHPTG